MFFNEHNSFISRISRKLWPLPIFIIPSALGLCFIAPDLFGSSLNTFIIFLSLVQVLIAVLVWKHWRRTQEQLNFVEHELSSLQGIVDVSRDAIIGVTTEGVIMSWNRGARGIYGYTTKEALGAPISMLFDHRRGQESNLLFAKVARGENVTQHEMVHLKKGRMPIDVSLTICPIMEEKTMSGASVVARDITERKRAAGSLAQQAAAMKASMDGMAIIDHGGVCIYLNDAYAKIFGYDDPDRLIGASWEMFYFEEELTRLKERIMPGVWRDWPWRGAYLSYDGQAVPCCMVSTPDRALGVELFALPRHVLSHHEFGVGPRNSGIANVSCVSARVSFPYERSGELIPPVHYRFLCTYRPPAPPCGMSAPPPELPLSRLATGERRSGPAYLPPDPGVDDMSMVPARSSLRSPVRCFQPREATVSRSRLPLAARLCCR
jgi:PAS domain S-box-containing protein